MALSLTIIPAAGDEGAAWASTASTYAGAMFCLVALVRQLQVRPEAEG